MTAGSVCCCVSWWVCRFVIVLVVVVVVVAARKHFRMNKTLVVVSNVHNDGGAQTPPFFHFLFWASSLYYGRAPETFMTRWVGGIFSRFSRRSMLGKRTLDDGFLFCFDSISHRLDLGLWCFCLHGPIFFLQYIYHWSFDLLKITLCQHCSAC